MVPFEVPPQTTSLEVRIQYDEDGAGIDLGCQGAAGWRGWSGGARRDFILDSDLATPGYVAGPLEPGLWSVVLGLHRVPATGVDIEVGISMPATRPVPSARGGGARLTAGTAPPRGSGRGLPAESGLTWFAGDFHAHSVHSDGRLSIDQLAALGVRSGLDFLGVTDHNTVSHHPFLADAGATHGITLLPGQEVTTHRGHANAFGDIGWIDFRTPAQHWVEEVERRGGILSINHPISGDCSWIHALSRRPAAVELWHSTWYRNMISTAPLAWLGNWSPGATLLGGSDFHTLEEPPRPGTPTTWVAAEDASVAAILDGVRAGRTAITGSVGYDGGALTPRLDGVPAIVRAGTDVVAVQAEGHVLVDGGGRRRIVMGAEESFAADPAEGPFQLVDADRRLVALCA